ERHAPARTSRNRITMPDRRPKLEILPAQPQTTGLPQGPDRPPRFPGWGRPARALKTIRDARQELARVYRRAAVGDVESSDLSRAVYALQVLAKTAEMEAQEERIVKLEKAIESLEAGGNLGR
ncbi:MAG: hypothetical protein LC676_09470, partial [Loktanella sp.]|nr:hypothetical protein [Loktanella sp.]